LYRRVLIKISGEAFGHNGFDFNRIEFIKNEIKEIVSEGIKLGVVVGAGNILRGKVLIKKGFPNVFSDYLGMLATILNGSILKETLVQSGVKAEVFSPVYYDKIVKRYDPFTVSEVLDAGVVAIFTGGTGLPFVTTDTTAVLRALEIGADVLIKATKVKGVYSGDPIKNKNARLFKFIRYSDVIKKGLGVMDLSAVALAKEKRLKVIVIDFFKKGNTLRAIKGKNIGTLIK